MADEKPKVPEALVVRPPEPKEPTEESTPAPPLLTKIITTLKKLNGWTWECSKCGDQYVNRIPPSSCQRCPK